MEEETITVEEMTIGCLMAWREGADIVFCIG